MSIIDTMITPDKISKEINSKSGVTSIIFEKEIDGKHTAITILSNDKRKLTLKSARINKKRRIVSSSAQFAKSNKSSTSETLRSLNSSNDSISKTEAKVNKIAEKSPKNDIKYRISHVNKAGLKTDKAKELKSKSDKENGADKMTKAFDKFLKKFNSTLKPVTAAAKLNNKGILKAKLELKKPIKTVSSINKIHKPQQSAKGKNAIYINKTGINNVMSSTNILKTNGVNNQKSSDAILRRRFIANERLLKENLKKIKKVSLNVQAVPRQVDKIVRKRK